MPLRICLVAAIIVAMMSVFTIEMALAQSPIDADLKIHVVNSNGLTVLPFESARIRVAVDLPLELEEEIKKQDFIVPIEIYRNRTSTDHFDAPKWLPIANLEIARQIMVESTPARSAQSIGLSAISIKKSSMTYQRSYSLPLSAIHSLGFHPLFENVGDVSFRIGHLGTPAEKRDKLTAFRVHVMAPMTTEEREIVSLIRSGDELKTTMMFPAACDLSSPKLGRECPVICSLKELLVQYPKSNYANYWRLSIGSRLMRSANYWIDINRVKRVEEMERIIRNRFDEHKASQLEFHLGWSPELVKKRVRAAIDAHEKGEYDQGRAARELTDLLIAPSPDHQEAISYLEKIDDPQFPHLPSALIWLRWIYRFHDDPKAVEITKRLDRDWADSYEWIREQTSVYGRQ